MRLVFLTVPPRTLALRWNAIFVAVAIFVWSTPEEDRPVFSALLGAWLSLTLALNWLTSRCAGRTLRDGWLVAASALFGAGAGALASVCAVLIMVFKDARHAHPYPDYPPALLAATLARLPAWALAGAFAAVGTVLFLSALVRRRANTASLENTPML